MFFGKLIGGLIGFLTLNFIGLLIGVFVGHIFDKGLENTKNQFSAEKQAEIQAAFFKAVFPLLGYLAKSDGRVSEEEVQATEELIKKMGLGASQRTEAIALFKDGTKDEFDAYLTMSDFLSVCGKFGNMRQILLVYLITLAYADGHLHKNEETILADIAKQLGYSSFAFNHLLGMVKAQSHFYRGNQEQSGYHEYYRNRGGAYDNAGSADELSLAYKALGVEPSVSDTDLKRAYRKLMSEYHPDKLTGRGVPDDMIKMATERSQEIQTAYELLKKSRKK